MIKLERFKKISSRLAITVMSLHLCLSLVAEEPTSIALVKNGKPALTVYVAKELLPIDQPPIVIGTLKGVKIFDDASEVRKSISNLVRFVKQMSGAELKVEGASNEANGCYIGLSSSFPWLNKNVSDLGEEGFLIQSDNKNLYILANKSLGIRNAVLALLMDQGCRWFFPGKAWEVIPKKATIAGAYNIRQTPSFYLGRKLWYGFGSYKQTGSDLAEWSYYNRMGGPREIIIGHTNYGIDTTLFEKHPEWFAMVKGKRYTKGWHSKVCYSNPEVIAQITKYALQEAEAGATSISLTPGDGLGYCECDLCFGTAKGGQVKEEKGSFFATRPDGVLVCTVSETLFNAVNQVAKEVGKKYPGVLLGCLAYSAYSHPPSFSLEPNVFVQTTTHFRRTPISMEEQMDTWGKKAKYLGVYCYWGVFQWDWDNPVIDRYTPEKLQEELQFFVKHNVTGMNGESSNNWGRMGLGYYIASQLLWNTNADIKVLMRDFYEKSFGSAAKAMERYYARWYGPGVAVIDPTGYKVNPLEEAKTAHDEFAELGFNRLMAPKATLVEAFKDLDEAARLVSGQPAYRERVNQIRMYAYYLLLREKVREASKTKNNEAIVEAIKNETIFGGRLINTNMVHSTALLNKAFLRRFETYKELLKDIPEAKEFEKGWRQAGTAPKHEEMEELWKQGKKYLGI